MTARRDPEIKTGARVRVHVRDGVAPRISYWGKVLAVRRGGLVVVRNDATRELVHVHVDYVAMIVDYSRGRELDLFMSASRAQGVAVMRGWALDPVTTSSDEGNASEKDPRVMAAVLRCRLLLEAQRRRSRVRLFYESDDATKHALRHVARNNVVRALGSEP